MPSSWWLVVGSWWLIAIISQPAAVLARPQQPAQLPDAPGRAVVERVCTNCHGAEILLPERTTQGWREALELMKGFGATASDEEWKTIHTYFMANLATLNVNKGAAEDFADVLLITPDAAQRIVEYREKNGAFKTADDVKKAPGVDPARVDAIRPRLFF